MQACYVNTTHPDFLNGHRVLIRMFAYVRTELTTNHQAMSIINDRMNASKPPTPEVKGGKLPPGAINGGKDLDVEIKKEEPSFFGSFFSSAKGAQKKKGVAAMDAVSV